ncbi:hypothetical protein JCM19235_3631 [Vibrio maritimus]|uniref:Uncharacterized protein n=1 Tax=Vibrio maritimus TaxID=990268 RepID=A0A090S2B2_9VIBR|nr:hypothetical protein JCM19235_3631 [Vibrio maritimus]
MKAFLSMSQHWGCDLTKLPNLENLVSDYVTNIQALGMRAAIEQLSK